MCDKGNTSEFTPVDDNESISTLEQALLHRDIATRQVARIISQMEVLERQTIEAKLSGDEALAQESVDRIEKLGVEFESANQRLITSIVKAIDFITSGSGESNQHKDVHINPKRSVIKG